MATLPDLTRRQRELLARLDRSPALSLDVLAEALGGDPAAVRREVEALAAAGWVHLHAELQGRRRIVRVETEAHRRLRHLDELYRFREQVRGAQ